jgi:hypothetical protein
MTDAPGADAVGDLLAELIGTAVRQLHGLPGVLIRDVVNMKPEAVLVKLRQYQVEGVDLRIAYLSQEAEPIASEIGFDPNTFSTRVEDAEKWRNQPGLDALIVVVAESDAAKLTSLEEFGIVEPPQLRALLVTKATLHFAQFNDVLPRWWEIIGRDEQMAFSDLVEYFLALENIGNDGIKHAAANEISSLGLLPDLGFFDAPSDRQLRARLDDNRALALRLANFSEEDRQKVDTVLDAEHDVVRRLELKNRLRNLQNYRRGGGLALTAQDAQHLLKISQATKSKPKPPTTDTGDEPADTTPPPKTLTLLAVESLLETDEERASSKEVEDSDLGGQSLDGALDSLGAQVLEIENDATVRPRPVTVDLPSGVQLSQEIQTDVLNLMQHTISNIKLGGLVESLGEDAAAMIRNFQQSPKVAATWKVSEIEELIDAFGEDNDDFKIIGKRFAAFLEARTALLPHLAALSIAPLLVATAPATRGLIKPVVDAYQLLIKTTESQYGELHHVYGDDAKTLVERILLIDTVYLRSQDSFVALLTPLNPLLLWHYSEYASAIDSQRTRLSELDKQLVRSEFERANGVPLFVASLAVPRLVSSTAPSNLPFTGKIGNLPHFGARSIARDPMGGVGSIRRLIETFVALHPAAREGFRLALLDPPDTGVLLGLICDLAEGGILEGAQITALRRGEQQGAELNLSSDEERRIQQRFGNHAERRFTFTTARVGPEDYGLPKGTIAHLYVAFDQTESQSAEAGGAPQAIQPLANRRRMVYRISAKSLDLEPALGGLLGDHNRFAGLAVGTNIVSYQAIHQSVQLGDKLRAGAAGVSWYVVADARVDRDLNLGGLRVLTARDGTRDVVAVTKSPDAFRRSLRDVVRQFNTVVSNESLDDLLGALSELLDAGLLSLRPGKSGETAPAHVKGILGLLVAVQSLKETTPAGFDRMILSLDDPMARRWLHLTDDPHRADLLVIDASPEGFLVTIVEVKTRQDTADEYVLKNGEVTGPAVGQLLSTHRLLARVFDRLSTDLLLTPSRKEILREHLYRELSKASYTSEAKKRWAHHSQELFEGTSEVDLRCELLNVQLGVAAVSLDVPHEAIAVDGEKKVNVTIRQLNEDGVPVLEEALRELNDSDEPGESGNPGLRSDGPDASLPSPPAPSLSSSPTAAPSDLSPSADDDAKRPRVVIGNSSAIGAPSREVWYDPQKPGQPLNNPHISISGETGSGKTQATKSILRGLMPLGIPALILDFKDDYSRPDYAEEEGFTVHDASFGSLPFNPLVPPADPISGRVNPMGHVHELASMLQRIYKLGDQQTFQLREAIKETYEIAGVGASPFVPAPGQTYLPFGAVRDVLIREEAHTLLGRLSPVFDLGLFADDSSELTLDDLLHNPSVIRLSQLPGDQVKNAVAEFFLMALYNFLVRREQPHKLERILVLDEAWRLVNSPFLEPLMREGRAFGLGIIVATQFPKDLPDQISGSTATRMFLSQTKAEQLRELQRTLVGKTSGADAEHLANIVRGLAPLETLLSNNQYKPWVRLRVKPYFERAAETGDAAHVGSDQ